MYASHNTPSFCPFLYLLPLPLFHLLPLWPSCLRKAPSLPAVVSLVAPTIVAPPQGEEREVAQGGAIAAKIPAEIHIMLEYLPRKYLQGTLRYLSPTALTGGSWSQEETWKERGREQGRGLENKGVHS